MSSGALLSDSTAVAATSANPTNSHSEQSTEPSFQKFFDSWIAQQDQYLHHLTSASQNHDKNTTAATGSSSPKGQDPSLVSLINRVVHHYEDYYRAKSRCAKQNVLAVLSPPWRSSLEEAFLWIGGWRPSLAFHLLYSKSGLQLEAQLSELLRGLSTGDLGDLSSSQFARIDHLQRRTIRQEKELTEKMAKQQEAVADTSMVELAHVVTEMMANVDGGGGSGGFGEEEDERVESALGMKEEGLEEVLQKADEFRLATLKGILEILTPIQSVHFLISAAELHLRIHEWGKKRDARQQQQDTSGTQ